MNEILESSKSPQSSSICNHHLARGDLLDSRFSNNVGPSHVMWSGNPDVFGPRRFIFSVRYS